MIFRGHPATQLLIRLRKLTGDSGALFSHRKSPVAGQFSKARSPLARKERTVVGPFSPLPAENHLSLNPRSNGKSPVIAYPAASRFGDSAGKREETIGISPVGTFVLLVLTRRVNARTGDFPPSARLRPVSFRGRYASNR